MRMPLTLAALLCGCSNAANHLGNPVLWPAYGIASAVQNAAYNDRRRDVAAAVQSDFSQILADIRSGGGAAISAAMQTALIPLDDQPGRLAQLRTDWDLYEDDPEALVVALMVFGP